ncbi:hypothetical protein PAHAL_8G219200 [Panicum hallii]|uniref:Uncharacterized protein n=1 Tax=Panicum hallii TaxID=206008 RepID=A0A2T8I9U6_9POAL|nr:hypothetical protein PAHAL_8G219200 [Panicum hallii]
METEIHGSMMRTRLGSYIFGSFCSPITSVALRLVIRIRSGWPWTFLAPPARTHPPAKYAAARLDLRFLLSQICVLLSSAPH